MPPCTVIPELVYEDVGQAIERQYHAEDLGGHQWTFSESIADVAPEEWGGTTADLGY
jgi:hypothetical protein